MSRIIDSHDKNMIGDKVKQIRKQKRMSQQALSNRLETLAIYVCRGSISRIEDKSRTVTDIELYGLSQVLDTPIDSFFENVPQDFRFTCSSQQKVSVTVNHEGVPKV